MNKFLKPSVVAASVALLVACGGDSGNPSTTINPLTGFFIDSAVQGLTYTTATQSGTTLEDGSFKYLPGESVTFKLYGQTISSPLGYEFLTPFDSSDTTLNPNYSINIVRFLMALDADGNPSNGISLPDYSQNININFNKSIAEFESVDNSEVVNALNSIASGRQLPSVLAAVTHINQSLSSINPDYTLNLEGKTATSTLSNSFCSNNLVLGWRYAFSAQSVSLTGSDTFNTQNNDVCTSPGEEILNIAYNGFEVPADFEVFTSGDFLDCAPNCSYKQLNRVTYQDPDPDGRTAVVWSWHTPNTKKIISAKTVLIDPDNPGQLAALSTSFEVVTLD
jgi:hypothetical protein